MNLCGLSRKKMLSIVMVIAIIQVIILSLVFLLNKRIFNTDEVYSYATSNSSQTMSPIVDTDNVVHINEWLSPDFIMQSVIVSKDEIFNYKHINEILKDDAHPPLYFYLLHFFSSFFPDRFSWIPSAIINTAALLVLQIYFYRLFLLFSKNRLHSVLAMSFFGFTSAAINMMSFSRNYTLASAFTIVYVYYLFRSVILHGSGKKSGKSIFIAAISLYLAAMTQYISIILAFFLTLLICIYLLIKRELKYMLKIGLSMLSAIILMVASFHYVLNQLLMEQPAMERSGEFPFLYELRITVHIFFNEIFGIKTPTQPTMFMFWFLWGLFGLAVIYLIMRFLFRSDEWFLKINNRIIKKITSISFHINDIFVLYLALLVSISAVSCIISYQFMMYFYYPTSDRYLFILYPYVAILLLVPVFLLLRKNVLIILLSLILITSSLIFGKKPYISFSAVSIEEAQAYMEDADVLILSPNYFSANLSVFYIERCEKVFYATYDTFEENKTVFKNGLSKDKPLYMMYLWPSFSTQAAEDLMKSKLKQLRDDNIILLNENPDYSGAKAIAGFGGYALFRLR